MANLATYGLFAASVAVRAVQVPLADFSGGMNLSGSNAPGLGINTGGRNPKLSDWSVLQQIGTARTPQRTQHIGGSGLGVGNDDVFVLNVVQGADINDTVSYITALTQAAPGAGYGAAGADPVNRTDETILVGDRVWGTNTV